LNTRNATNHAFALQDDLIFINPQLNVDGYSGVTIHPRASTGPDAAAIRTYPPHTRPLLN
jgi:hypothetical protein